MPNLLLWARGSSPHTRGALRNVAHNTPLGRIIPAYAGSTSALRSSIMALADHPRIRGEHQRPQVIDHGFGGSSPHTRGARLRPLKDFAPRPIIPAYAGSTTSPAQRLRAETNHPRIRGEHSPTASATTPRARIIPAYAGSTADPPTRQTILDDHPRIRGEHGFGMVKDGLKWGSSPHTRGALRSSSSGFLSLGIIPAYAGSTRRCMSGRSNRRDHPRIRGEHCRSTR